MTPSVSYVTKEIRIQILTVTLKNGSELLHDVSRLGFTERQKTLQGVNIHTIPCLNGSLNVPLDDCRILFTNPRKLKCLAIRRLRSIP